MNNTLKRIFVCIFVFLLLTACTTTLSTISENPQRFSGKTVSVKGRVSTVINVPFTDFSVFILEDEVIKAAVFTVSNYTKGDDVKVTAEVVSFPEGDFKQKGDEIIRQIAEFLTNNDLSTEDQAERMASSVLKVINGLGTKLGQYFFLLEEKEE